MRPKEFYSFDELHKEFWKFPEFKIRKDQLLIRLLWDLEKEPLPGRYLAYIFDTGKEYKTCKIKIEVIKKQLRERGCEIRRKYGDSE